MFPSKLQVFAARFLRRTLVYWSAIPLAVSLLQQVTLSKSRATVPVPALKMIISVSIGKFTSSSDGTEITTASVEFTTMSQPASVRARVLLPASVTCAEEHSCALTLPASLIAAAPILAGVISSVPPVLWLSA